MSQVIESSGNNLDRDIGLVRRQAVQVAESASQITVTANEVAEGAEVQLRVLDETVAIAMR
jgi:methyl-accepting chemotaxis protein